MLSGLYSRLNVKRWFTFESCSVLLDILVLGSSEEMLYCVLAVVKFTELSEKL